MHHPFNMPTLAPGVEYKQCQPCIPMSFLSLFSAQSIFIQFYGKCTHFVQLPECDFPMPPIYFQVCFFQIQVLLPQHFFMFYRGSNPCSYWTHLLRTTVTYVELKGRPCKLEKVSHTSSNSWFFFLCQGLPLFMLIPPKGCMHVAASGANRTESVLCSDSAERNRVQRSLGRWWCSAEIPLSGPTLQDNLEAAQIHSRLIRRNHPWAGASQNTSGFRLIYNITVA